MTDLLNILFLKETKVFFFWFEALSLKLCHLYSYYKKGLDRFISI